VVVPSRFAAGRNKAVRENESVRIDRRTAAGACLAAVWACGRKKVAGFPGYAFVANEDGMAVAAVDLETFTLARRIPLDGKPTSVLAHPTRDAVYVLTPGTGTLHELTASSLAHRRKSRLARGTVSMRLAHDGAALWVLCHDPRELLRVDVESLRPSQRIPLAAAPVSFDLSEQGAKAGVSHDNGSLSIVDLVAGVAGVVRTGGRAGIVRFRSDGKYLLIGDPARMLTILETESGKVVTRLPLALRPDNFCLKADGGQLFITGEGMDAVVVVYPYSTEVAQTVLAGRMPGAMAVSKSPGDGYLFVANPATGDVTILDIETSRAIATVSVGAEPGFIAVTPDDQFALVLNRRSGNVAVIRIAAIVPSRTRSAPLFTVIPVGSRPVSVAVKAL
jgi:YVTN family beta-propeller protein